MNDEQKKVFDALAKAEADAIIKLSVLACVECPDNKFSPDSEEDCDAVETLILELISEGDPFAATVASAGHDLVMREFKLSETPDHEIMKKVILQKTQTEKYQQFGKYLSNSLTHYIKFPDKKVRDKLRRVAQLMDR